MILSPPSLTAQTLLKLLTVLEEQRRQLSDKIAEESVRIVDVMALRRKYPSNLELKSQYEQYQVNSDEFMRQYENIARRIFSIKRELHNPLADSPRKNPDTE